MTHAELTQTLKALQLPKMSLAYVEAARVAEKKKSTYEQYLADLAEQELELKSQARIQRLMKEAKLPLLKTQEAFDFSQIMGLSEVEFKRLTQGDFLREAANVVFFGSFGVGKTHLAIALTQKLCEKGFRCYFTSTHVLIEHLLEAQKDLTFTQLFKRLDRFDLLVCDELGYLPQTKDGADLLFQLISQRDERKSILITTNLTYSEWDKVFVNPLNTAAAVDRIIHKCETFNIQGPSWRAEAAKKRKTVKTTLTPEQGEPINASSTGQF
jgi:DNA replication protein DnaC